MKPRFGAIAGIHERLRLGERPLNQLALLANKEMALACYEFFFPARPRISPSTAVSRVAHELELFYDVARAMLPDELWMGLAEESSRSASQSMSAEQVLALPFEDMEFTDIAYRFNEVEARLVWRYIIKAKPVISKRTFFSGLARIMDLPATPILGNMNRDTLTKMFDDPGAIQSLERWWEHPRAFPAPARWKAWLKLHSPGDDYLGVIVPKGPVLYEWNGVIRKRTGEVVRELDYFSTEYEGNMLREFVDSGYGRETTLDWVDARTPDDPFSERSKIGDVKHFSMSQHAAWEYVVEALANESVACIRFIRKDAVFKPDAVMGYVVYPHRSRVFLRLHESDESHWTLAALDGLHDYEPVARIPAEAKVKVDDDECHVVEVAVINVNEDGYINQCRFISRRPDLGISDVVQLTELIERGMEDASE